MRSTLTIEATEPRTMRELLDQREAFKGAAAIVSSQNPGKPDIDALTDPYHARMNELEVMASKIALRSIRDCIDAFDVYETMIGPDDCIYGDKRDHLLLQSIRRALTKLDHPAGASERRQQPSPQPAESRCVSTVEIVDRLNNARAAMAVLVEVAERKACDRNSSSLEKASGNGVLAILYEQMDHLETLRDELYPEGAESD